MIHEPNATHASSAITSPVEALGQARVGSP